MSNSLKLLQNERAAMLPPELEDRISRHLGALAHFGNVVELFVPNALQVVVRLVGGEELPCLPKNRRRRNLPDTDWRKAPPKGPGGG